MMVHDAGEGLVEEADLPDDVEPAHRVELDGGVLVVGQRTALLQYRGRHAQLAHVVQHSRVADRAHPLEPHPDLRGDHHRAARHPLAVPPGVEVLGLHRLAQGADRRLIGPLLRGELRHRPAGHEDRDQHEDRREWPEDRPERGDQDAERAVPEVRQPQLEVEADPARRRSRVPGQPEQRVQQHEVHGHVDNSRHGERADEAREGTRPWRPHPAAAGQVHPAGQVRAERVHAGIEQPLHEVRPAPQAEQRAAAIEQRRASAGQLAHRRQPQHRAAQARDAPALFIDPQKGRRVTRARVDDLGAENPRVLGRREVPLEQDRSAALARVQRRGKPGRQRLAFESAHDELPTERAHGKL